MGRRDQLHARAAELAAQPAQPGQAGGAGSYAGRGARAHRCLRGPLPRGRAGPGAGRAALGRIGRSAGRRPGICAWSWPAADSRGPGERGWRRAVHRHAEEPPGPDCAAGGRTGADHRSVERGKEPEAWLFAAPGGGPLRESNWKRPVGWRDGQGGNRCAGCARSRSAPYCCIAMAGRWGWPEGGAAGAGARHRGDDDGSLWSPGGCQLVAGRPADRGHHGASELPEEPIRTENESARDAKNPQ